MKKVSQPELRKSLNKKEGKVLQNLIGKECRLWTWSPIEAGNEIVTNSLLSFISSLDIKPFVPNRELKG